MAMSYQTALMASDGQRTRPAHERWASRGSAIAFGAGLWSIIAPFMLARGSVGENLVGYWKVVLIGACVLVTALVRSLAPLETPWLSLVTAGLGVWSIVEGMAGDGSAARNAVAVGMLITVSAGASAFTTFRHRWRW